MNRKSDDVFFVATIMLVLVFLFSYFTLLFAFRNHREHHCMIEIYGMNYHVNNVKLDEFVQIDNACYKVISSWDSPSYPNYVRIRKKIHVKFPCTDEVLKTIDKQKDFEKCLAKKNQ